LLCVAKVGQSRISRRIIWSDFRLTHGFVGSIWFLFCFYSVCGFWEFVGILLRVELDLLIFIWFLSRISRRRREQESLEREDE
jgi:hypothetical protein